MQRAMAKDPSDRFRTMADLCDELEACLDEVRGRAAPAAVTAVVPAVGKARRARRRVWPALLLLAALAGAAALLAYAISQRDDGGNGTGSATGPQPAAVRVRGVSAYDPFGDRTEHDAFARRATDGDPATYWTTETYHSGLAGVDKEGVGLVLDAGRPVRLSRLGIVTDTPGYAAPIRAGPSRSSFPETLASGRRIGGRTQIGLAGDGEHRYFLIWITDLGAGYENAHVNEVSVAA